MASVNKAIIVGHLGRDPETRYMPSGDAMTNITVATTDEWKDKNSGEKKSQTEWHSITFFGKLAEIAGQYLKKGAQVYIEGSLRTRKYTDKNGVEKYATDIKADQMQMLGAKPTGTQAPVSRQPTDAQRATGAPASHQGFKQQAARPSPDFSDMDENIPF